MPNLPQHLPMVELRPGDPVADILGIEGNLGAPVTAVLALGEHFAIAGGDGRIAFASDDFEAAEVHQVHGGAILSAVLSNGGVLTGGDDGRVAWTAPGKGTREIWRSADTWVDHVAAGAGGAIAWSCGKRLHLKRGNSDISKLEQPTSVGGLAFAPKSARIAASHYGGVTVWTFTGAVPSKRALNWKGSHLDVTWSLSERFLVTSMSENALHGWRLSDKADFEMPGYPTKPRSLAWSRKGDWLATSGGNEVLLWSFKGKNGPMGSSPDVLSWGRTPVSRVAFHPFNAYVVAGYRDGSIVLSRQEDKSDLNVRHARGAAISALAWSVDGCRIAYGTTDGVAGVVDFTALDARLAQKR